MRITGLRCSGASTLSASGTVGDIRASIGRRVAGRHLVGVGLGTRVAQVTTAGRRLGHGQPGPEVASAEAQDHAAAEFVHRLWSASVMRSDWLTDETGGSRMPREIRRTGRYDVGEDPARITDAEGHVWPQRPLAQVRCARRAARTIDAVKEEDTSALGIARTVGVANRAEARLADVPLIVEDALGQARRLADSGAPTEAVKAILDLVAALREGRG